MNREEIDREIATLTAGKNLPAHAAPSLKTVLQFRHGLEGDQACPYCGGRLRVEERGSALRVRCPCGQSDHDLRGL